MTRPEQWREQQTKGLAMESAEAKGRLDRALAAFAAADGYLLENNLGERCIAGRLAMHVQHAFADEGLVVDVEYNRLGAAVKRLETLPAECIRRKIRPGDPAVVPDIIVHQRGEAGQNVLVIELKKTDNPEGQGCDGERLRAFREELGYEFGALVECETRFLYDKAIRVVDWLHD